MIAETEQAPLEFKQEKEEIEKRISSCFSRSEVRETTGHYLEALIRPVARKNCWQLAEEAGEENPYGMQRLLRKAHWDAEVVRDDLRSYVVDRLADGEETIGVIDETGFLKKGNKSVGVQRQYSGTAGKIENCQIGVFLAYVVSRGKAFIDRELYLPQEWAQDQARRQEAGVPPDIRFATKPELALRMLKRAKEAGVVFDWITADEPYGNNRALRRWLGKEHQPYVLAISYNQYVWKPDLSRHQAKSLAQEIPANGWQRLSVGEGAKGPRVYDWAWVRLTHLGTDLPEGWGRWLLLRQNIEKPEEIASYLAAGPENTALDTLAKVAGKRWSIEVSFEEAKGEAGLDEYEVRQWEGWYRHITLSLLAHAYLVVCRAYGKEKGVIMS